MQSTDLIALTERLLKQHGDTPYGKSHDGNILLASEDDRAVDISACSATEEEEFALLTVMEPLLEDVQAKDVDMGLLVEANEMAPLRVRGPVS